MGSRHGGSTRICKFTRDGGRHDLVCSVGPNLFAFDGSTGKEQWRVKSETQFWSLALAHPLVYVGNSDGHIYAYDQKTGKERWRFRSQFGSRDDIWSAPAIAADRLFVGSRDQSVYALDAPPDGKSGNSRRLATPWETPS